MGLNISEHNASTATHDLLKVLNKQQETEDFSLLSQSDKQPLDRIVVFYKDGRFDNYIPKEKK